MSPLPSLYLETIQRASYIIVQRYSNIQIGATNRTSRQGRTFHPLMQFLKNDVFDDFIGCLIV